MCTKYQYPYQNVVLQNARVTTTLLNWETTILLKLENCGIWNRGIGAKAQILTKFGMFDF